MKVESLAHDSSNLRQHSNVIVCYFSARKASRFSKAGLTFVSRTPVGWVPSFPAARQVTVDVIWSCFLGLFEVIVHFPFKNHHLGLICCIFFSGKWKANPRFADLEADIAVAFLWNEVLKNCNRIWTKISASIDIIIFQTIGLFWFLASVSIKAFRPVVHPLSSLCFQWSTHCIGLIDRVGIQKCEK